MADETKLTSQLTIKTGMASGDRVVIVSYSGPNTVTATIDVANLFANTNVPIAANTLTLKELSTPANSAVTSLPGHIWFDSGFIYVTTANNVTKRCALSSF
jgi:hypothetical protein